MISVVSGHQSLELVRSRMRIYAYWLLHGVVTALRLATSSWFRSRGDANLPEPCDAPRVLSARRIAPLGSELLRPDWIGTYPTREPPGLTSLRFSPFTLIPTGPDPALSIKL